MADIKISQLGEDLAVTDNDILPMTASGVTSKVKASTMKSYMVDDLEVSDLYDTTITTPVDDDGLVYDATAQKWENVPITTKEQWKKNGAYNVGYHNFTTQTLNGVTFTVNADGSITLNNTATAATTVNFFITANASNVGLKEGTTYKLVGLTPTTPECSLKVNCFYNSANHVAEDTGDGAIFTFTGTSYADFAYYFYLIIPNGTAFNNDTIYPMITTDLNATYNDYQPYAMTNLELTPQVLYNQNGIYICKQGKIVVVQFFDAKPNDIASLNFASLGAKPVKTTSTFQCRCDSKPTIVDLNTNGTVGTLGYYASYGSTYTDLMLDTSKKVFGSICFVSE